MSAVPAKPSLWPLLVALCGVLLAAAELCVWGFVFWVCWSVSWPLMKFMWAILV